MPRLTVTASKKQATALIAGCVILFIAFGLLVYGRFATSVGMAGLYNRASTGVAFMLFGASMLVFTPCLYLQRMHKRHIDAAQLGRELMGIAGGFACYVVPFILAMGALSAADTIGAVGLVLAVAFGAIPFVYRRHRKMHPIAYKHTGSAALVAFCGLMALFALVGGAFSCSEVADDLSAGWRQDTFAFYGATVDRPSGRGAMLEQVTYEVDLYRDAAAVEAGEPDARLSVNEMDWPAVERVFEEPLAEIRWYPKTRTLVGAQDVDSVLSAGDPIE